MFNFQIHKIPEKTKPYFEKWWAFVDAVETAINSNLSAIEVLQGQVGAGANDNIGDIRITSGTLPAAQYLGPIPYPSGLTNLSKEIYAKLYATAGFSGSDSALWTQETSGVTGDINAIVHNGTNYIAYGAAGIALYSLDGTTWNEVGDIGGTAPASAVNAAAYNSNEHAVVFVVGNGSYIGASADYGKTITAKSLSFVEAYDIRDIKEFGGVFYIVGTRVVGSTYYSAVASFTYNSGTGVITWLTAAEGIPGQYSAIQFDGTTYVIIAGNNGTTAATARSSNLTTWTTVGSHSAFANYNDIIFVGGVWVVAGSKDGFSGAVRYSVGSGETWVTVDTGAKNLNFVRYDAYNYQFVFGGADDNGATFIYTWQNGDPTATPQNTGAATALNDYAENGFGQSVIVGNGGSIYSFSPYSGNFSELATHDVDSGNPTRVFSDSCIGKNGDLVVTLKDGNTVYVYSSSDWRTFTLRDSVTMTGVHHGEIFYDSIHDCYVLFMSNGANSYFSKFYRTTNLLTTPFSLAYTDIYNNLSSLYHLVYRSDGTFLCTSTFGNDYDAGHGKVALSTDGGLNWTRYDGINGVNGVDCQITDLTVIDGKFLLFTGGYYGASDRGKVFYSTSGHGDWVEITFADVAGCNGHCGIRKVGNTYYYWNAEGNPASLYTNYIWISSSLTSGYVKTAINGGKRIMPWSDALNEASSVWPIGDKLTAYMKTNSGTFALNYSANGVDWTPFTTPTNDPECLAIYYGNIPIINGPDGLTLLKHGTNTLYVYDYRPNVVLNTFDIPWPYPSQTLAAPYNAYIKWSD